MKEDPYKYHKKNPDILIEEEKKATNPIFMQPSDPKAKKNFLKKKKSKNMNKFLAYQNLLEGNSGHKNEPIAPEMINPSYRRSAEKENKIFSTEGNGSIDRPFNYFRYQGTKPQYHKNSDLFKRAEDHLLEVKHPRDAEHTKKCLSNKFRSGQKPPGFSKHFF